MMVDNWWQAPARPFNEAVGTAARMRQDNLTKPPGSLGRLEEMAVRLAAMQGRARPGADRVWIAVFAGDHGVVAEGVSAFPQAVTQQMLANFVAGGGAIAVLARELGASLEVIDVGSLAPEPMPGVLWDKAGQGTANLATGPAMTEAEVIAALDAGRRSAERALAAGAELYLGGEMGIGNTTAAAALACTLLDLAGRELAGPGTGLDGHGVAHKAAVIERALALHAGAAREPLEALRRLGGYELAALAGACIACAQAGLPVLVDGFIATAAALAAVRINPGARDWLIFGHASAEPGHARLLAALSARPLLALDMRLGEGSGAALAVPLLRLACALHNGMATFAEAGVSG
ncbi:MAG: nicotinate-nucleotide--dimethylbenzimidazole phosphoribosyltransferase [Hydrogenophilaceae bacterium]